MDSQIISDTGPLITLEKLSDGYSFIRTLYQKIIIPTAVEIELYRGQFVSAKAYMSHYGIEDLIEVIEVRENEYLVGEELLDEGEKEAIHLALERKLPLLIEEEIGRKFATELRLSISGIAGQIVKAFRKNMIDQEDAERKLVELLQAGRINQRIYAGLIEAIRSLS